MGRKRTNIKQPIQQGVAKVPVVMQLEALECGAASLTMVLAYYNKWIPLEQVRADCGISRDGSNAKSILRAARYYGLEARGYRMEPEALKENGTFPCIIHWEFNHFVVLKGFKGNTVYINDPARGNITLSMEQFDSGFTGICLLFEPGENFVPSGQQKSMLAYAKKRLKKTGTAFAFVVLTTIITSLMGVISPAFSRVFMDRLLTGENPTWFMPFMLGFSLFIGIQIVIMFIQAIYALRISGKMTVVGSAGYMWKVFHLPISFFSQRMSGDIQQRMMENATIANVLINTLAPLVLDGIMLVFYLVIMFRYSVLLSLIGISSIAIHLLLARMISKRRVNITRVQMRDEGKLYSATVSGMEMIETIKSAGAENAFFAKWSGYQASANAQKVKLDELEKRYGILPEMVSLILSNVVLFLGVYLVIEGSFTVGMLFAFQGILQSFMAPATTFIGAGATLQEMRTQMERVDDVMEYPEDCIFSEMEYAEDKEYNKLSGNVELKNITFGYSKLGEPLIKDFSLQLSTGKCVAIVGSSGCGKSTLAKLISGLYQPWEGSILFDGKAMGEIDKSIFKSSLAVVDQNIILFEDTIANNIKMWDESIEDFEVILAARDAQIHDDIMERVGGYNYKLSEGGKDFSGGQRQRLEIARVLAQDPTIIIMDEATSALDAKTEYDVVKSIKERGITCIVIAHRLSTIRDSDEIILLDKGDVVDRGTHEELLGRCAAYKELVTSE